MRTGTELLHRVPPPPLGATLVARPARLCVIVPDVEGVSWQRMVEHALAAQTRVWGGIANIVVPFTPGVTRDEVFWRLIDVFDPDLVGVHVPTSADAIAIAPEVHDSTVARLRADLLQTFDEQAVEDHLLQVADKPFWRFTLPEELNERLLSRIAPLRGGDAPRFVHTDGTSPPSSPLTDLAVLRNLSGPILNVETQSGDDVSRLLLTHAHGGFCRPFVPTSRLWEWKSRIVTSRKMPP